MTANTAELNTQTGQPADLDPFDLDIHVIEFGDSAASLINLTDDGCGSTCASPCVTNA